MLLVGRLESPIDLVRRMASSIALVFSKVVDPKNPLYLDDNCCEPVDWEFGMLPQRKQIAAASHNEDENKSKLFLREDRKSASDEKKQRVIKHTSAENNALIQELADPDENRNPVEVNGEHFSGEEDDDDSSDSSLKPYDLSDDDTDLQRKFSQLGDIAAALRKHDDPDGVSSYFIWLIFSIDALLSSIYTLK